MKILLAIDDSLCSDAAIEEVARWPRLPQSEVRVVSVDAPLEPSLLRNAGDVFEEIVKQQRSESSKRLLGAKNLLEQKVPGLHVTASLLEGWPPEAIVQEAERFGADLVVLGSHGSGPLRRFFLGSVSQYVAHRAPCSVLIVRRPVGSSLVEDPPATP